MVFCSASLNHRGGSWRLTARAIAMLNHLVVEAGDFDVSMKYVLVASVSAVATSSFCYIPGFARNEASLDRQLYGGDVTD